MHPLSRIDERWFLRALFGLSLTASLALVVAHQGGYELRPTGRVDAPARGPEAPSR